MEDEKFLTTDETCSRLNKTPQGLEYMVASKKLRRFKRGIGNLNYYLESEVDELLKIKEAA